MFRGLGFRVWMRAVRSEPSPTVPALTKQRRFTGVGGGGVFDRFFVSMESLWYLSFKVCTIIRSV